MTAFCLRVTVFLLLQVLLFWALAWNPDFPHDTHYLAAFIDKHRRLETTPPPRIVLVGGSNLAVGIRSDWLEQALHRPVVNLGLVAAAGIEFMLDDAAPNIRPGDVVVLSLEWYLFPERTTLLHLSQLVEYHPASLRAVPWQRWPRLLELDGLSMIGTVVRRSLGFPAEASEGADLRSRFNRWGDFTGYYAATTNLATALAGRPLEPPARLGAMTPEVRAALKRFTRHCDQLGARVLFTCPPGSLEALQRQGADLERMMAALRAIPHLEVIDTPADEVYDHTLLLDASYHLTAAGCRERAARLLPRLKARMGLMAPRPQ